MKRRERAGRTGFSLVEVVLALAIMSFCVIVLLAILPVSLTSIKNATEETAGINVISTIVSDLKSTPVTNAASSIYHLTLPTAAATTKTFVVDQAGAVLAGANASGARYSVTITFNAPTAQNTVTGMAKVTWPAQAAIPIGTVESYFSINRN